MDEKIEKPSNVIIISLRTTNYQVHEQGSGKSGCCRGTFVVGLSAGDSWSMPKACPVIGLNGHPTTATRWLTIG